MVTDHSEIKIWQWNSNSYNRKKAASTQLIHARKIKPYVILLHELGEGKPPDSISLKENGTARPALYPDHGKVRGIAILIRKGFRFAERHSPYKGLEAVFVEILPRKTVKRNIFVINVNRAPSDGSRFQQIARNSSTTGR
ncbi:hypothetical protein HPB52_011449 [Rhipicephalus sanguineus]|uniref:Uncharacterized protein n=1 Tax=Rhipicephalus sanguineus TaxID=34632 RepID=A0A9D4PCU7_RHISA|nr:hypothetical protein HPB52_011449 [Rhipicephalus sanguineus]